MNSLTLLHLASRATDSKTDSVIVKRYSFKIRGEVYRGTSTPEYDSSCTPYILVSNNTRLTHGLTQTTQLNSTLLEKYLQIQHTRPVRR